MVAYPESSTIADKYQSISKMGESDTPNHNAIVLYGAKYLRIEERQTQNPEADEVQIRIRGTGICGTDLHYYSQGRNGIS